MKRACSIWLGGYLVLAVAIGAIAYRRLPRMETAIGAGFIGGILAWMGIGYFVGIRKKLGELKMIRRSESGEPPGAGERIAAVGRIVPTGATLRSPMTRSECVAYKYEITSGVGSDEVTYYSGFALTPSMIQGPRSSTRLLAWPDPQFTLKYIPSEAAASNAAEYVRSVEFHQPSIANMRAAFKEMMDVYRDDDGTVRWDLSGISKPPVFETSTFREWILQAGEPVCVFGRFSADRNGIVPSDTPLLEPVTLERGESWVFANRKVFGAIRWFIGGVIFTGTTIAAILAFLAFVPLDAAEQMDPSRRTLWPEVRLERFIDKNIRPRVPKHLDTGVVSVSLPLGAAIGRATGGGQDETVSRASAHTANGDTTIDIDDGVVSLAIDRYNRPFRVRILGQDVPASDAEVQIVGRDDNALNGRLTVLTSSGPLARVTFHAAIH